MSSLYVRHTRSDQPTDNRWDATIGPLEDQRNGGIKHTIQSLFCRPRQPAVEVWSLLMASLGVFAADKLFNRRQTEDGWTRDIRISVPVGTATDDLASGLRMCLGFLSGDRWSVELREARLRPRCRCYYADDFHPDAVALFSGGVDSLVNAINLLEDGQRVLLLGHHDKSFDAGVQSKLARNLQKTYGAGKVRQVSVQVQVLNGRERSTRSRSMLFIALGLSAASSFGDDIPLDVAENGYIGVNTPLTPGRLGSYSTRTTHPLYLERVQLVLKELGIRHELRNPFQHLTKGEVLGTCRNKPLLRALYPLSVSCAHPTQGRWAGAPPGNCGYCYPCLIRRASAHKHGMDDPAGYGCDVAGDPSVLARGGKSSEHIRAVLMLISRFSKGQIDARTQILKTGSLGAKQVQLDEYARVFEAGSREIMDWLREVGCRDIKRFAGL
jgi:7-cyano-7-deazaguanine synthase in queuosine biosynthesis